MTTDPASTAAELAAVTDAVERAGRRLADLAEPYLNGDRDDVVTALYEAERQVLGAVRALHRAARTLDR